MPLDTSRMVFKGHLTSPDIKQYADLLTGVMTDQPITLGNFLRFTPDNTQDIGASGANRPRDLFLGRNLNAMAGTIVTGNVQPSSGNLNLMSQTGTWIIVGAGGHLLTGTDNTLDIGAGAGNRPRTLYLGTSLVLPDKGWVIGAQGSGASTINVLRKSDFQYAGGNTYPVIQLGSGNSIAVGVDVSTIAGGSFNGNSEFILPNSFGWLQVNAGGTDYIGLMRATNGALTIYGSTITTNPGAIAGASLANAGVTNAKLASDTARANLLTNGGFEIWQRGNGAFTANGAYTADRWWISLGSGSSMSVSRSTVGQAGKYCATIVYTHSQASQLVQRLADGVPLSMQVSASALVQTSTAGVVTVTLSADGTGSPVSNSTAHTGNGAWQKLSASIVVPGDATIVQVALTMTGSCTVNIDNAMLVVGSQPADYAPLHPADDLARCRRYYQIYPEAAAQVFQYSFYCSAAQNFSWTHILPTRMAVVPTWTRGTWQGSIQPNNGGTSADCLLIYFTIPSAGMYNIYSPNAANTPGHILEANP